MVYVVEENERVNVARGVVGVMREALLHWDKLRYRPWHRRTENRLVNPNGSAAVSV